MQMVTQFARSLCCTWAEGVLHSVVGRSGRSTAGIQAYEVGDGFGSVGGGKSGTVLPGAFYDHLAFFAALENFHDVDDGHGSHACPVAVHDYYANHVNYANHDDLGDGATRYCAADRTKVVRCCGPSGPQWAWS